MIPVGAGLAIQWAGDCLGGGLYDGPRYTGGPVSWCQKYGGTLRCTTTDWSAAPVAGGTFITFNNVTVDQVGSPGFIFAFTGDLASWADNPSPRAGVTKTGSGYPVHVNLLWTPGVFNYGTGTVTTPGTTFNSNACVIKAGSSGSGDPNAIDLIVNIAGDGRTFGTGQDAFKINGGSNINWTTGDGMINGGPRSSAAVHQDLVQCQGGTNINGWGLILGDWPNKRSTDATDGGVIKLTGGFTNSTFTAVKGVGANAGLVPNNYGETVTFTDVVIRLGQGRNETDIGVTGLDVGTPAGGSGGLIATAPPGVTYVNVVGDPYTPWRSEPGAFNTFLDNGAF